MFSVAICDDEKVICKEIKHFLEPYIRDKIVCTKLFYSGERLYEAILSGSHFDLIFLDIELKLLSGVMVGKKIREELCNETVHIVFISGKPEYALELFSIRPLHFLTKPFTKKQVTDIVEKAMNLSVIYNDFFEFKIEKTSYKICYGNILYFESRARKIILYTEQKNYEFYGRLNKVEDETHNYFIRIHQSYLVNPLFINYYEYNKVTVSDNQTLFISELYRKVVKSKLLKNWRNL